MEDMRRQDEILKASPSPPLSCVHQAITPAMCRVCPQATLRSSIQAAHNEQKATEQHLKEMLASLQPYADTVKQRSIQKARQRSKSPPRQHRGRRRKDEVSIEQQAEDASARADAVPYLSTVEALRKAASKEMDMGAGREGEAVAVR